MSDDNIYEIAKDVNDSFFLRKSGSEKVRQNIISFDEQLKVCKTLNLFYRNVSNLT